MTYFCSRGLGAAHRVIYYRALALALFLGLALLFTYPTALDLTSQHPGEAEGDAKTYLWNYWWVGRALAHGVNPLVTDVIFHPLGIGLSLHSLGVAQGVAIAALRPLLGPVASVNVWLIWTFVGSGLFTMGLARRLGLSRSASALAGVIFAFCPYRLARLAGHYDLLGTEWIPLYAWMLYSWTDATAIERAPWKSRYAWGCILAAAGCAYTSLTYFILVGLFTVIFILHRIVFERVTSPRRLLTTAGWLLLGTTLLVSPLLIQLGSDLQQQLPNYEGVERYVADGLGYITPPDRLSWEANRTEVTVYIGLAIPALLIVGMFLHRLRRAFSFWWLSGSAFLLLSFGPTLKIAGESTGVPLPFRAVQWIPFFEQLRAPSRFSILVALSCSILVGAVAMELSSRLVTRRAALLMITAIGMLILAEFYRGPISTFPAAPDAVYSRLSEMEPGALLEIPGIEQDAAEIMFHQTSHQKPILIGSIARVPRLKMDYFFGLHLIRPLIDLRKAKIVIDERLLNAERATAPQVARFLDLKYLILDPAYDKRGILTFVRSVLPTETIEENAERRVLVVRSEDLPPSPRTISVDMPVARQHFATGWSDTQGEEDDSHRWATSDHTLILFRWPDTTTAQLGMVVAGSAGERDSGDAARVTARLDGRHIGSLTLSADWKSWRMPIPLQVAQHGIARLELEFENFAPAGVVHRPERGGARIQRLVLHR